MDDPIITTRDGLTTLFNRAMRDFLHAPGTMEAYRANPISFTRNCCFNFPRLAVAILSGRTHSAQTRLLHLFDEGCFGRRAKAPTASAFCQARGKVQPELFWDWAEVGTRFFYDNYVQYGFAPTWNGRFLWAVDATMVTVPDTQETRAAYGAHQN